MTDHLPECWIVSHSNPLNGCICDRLRACEQRVTKQWEGLRGWGETYAYKSGKDSGFESGLWAAREAVESMVIETAGNSAATVDQALAAIDALRQTPEVDEQEPN